VPAYSSRPNGIIAVSGALICAICRTLQYRELGTHTRSIAQQHSFRLTTDDVSTARDDSSQRTDSSWRQLHVCLFYNPDCQLMMPIVLLKSFSNAGASDIHSRTDSHSTRQILHLLACLTCQGRLPAKTLEVFALLLFYYKTPVPLAEIRVALKTNFYKLLFVVSTRQQILWIVQ
jgi:hypothetical protein